MEKDLKKGDNKIKNADQFAFSLRYFLSACFLNLFMLRVFKRTQAAQHDQYIQSPFLETLIRARYVVIMCVYSNRKS